MNAPFQQQGSKEWLEWRKSCIGGSDAPIIMGLSPYATPFSLWSEKVGHRPPKEMTQAMKRGHELEDLARKQFIDKTGIFMTPRVMIHPEYPWLIASLDGISDGLNLLEIKCNNRINHQIAYNNDIVDHHFCQLQHQMLVTGADMVYYYSFDGEDGVIVRVKRDQAYIDDLFCAEQKFYKCLVDMVAPPLTDKDYLDFSDNEAFVALAKEYSATKTQLKALEESKEALGNALMALANKQPCKGGGIRIQHYHRKGSVDYSKIPELKGVDLDFYRKDGTDVWSIVND